MKRILSLLVLVPALFLASACVTHITSDVTQNPPPMEKFSNFQRIEMGPVRLVAPYAGQDANEAALLKIQENVDSRMQPKLATWNTSAAPGSAGTLVVDPIVLEIKFISGGSRFWAGAMAGSSAVKVHVKITNKETGMLVAEPEFYARAAAMGGAYSFGGTDNAMLVRIANRISDYMISNYDAAVGGPSGAEPAKK